MRGNFLVIACNLFLKLEISVIHVADRVLLCNAALEFCYSISRRKDVIELGVHGAFIFQYCLCAELGKNVAEHVFFTTKKRKE